MEELLDLKRRLEQERPAAWNELPDISLYMDQIISYMPRQLIHFDDRDALTSAMVNNYIKDGLVPRAEGKRYAPVHLAYLTAVCALKKVLSVRDISNLIHSGEELGMDAEAMYGYFRYRRNHRPRCRAVGTGQTSPDPCPAELRLSAGLRPHSGYSGAHCRGTPEENQEIIHPTRDKGVIL